MPSKTQTKNKKILNGVPYLAVFNKLLLIAAIGCFIAYLISMNCLSIRGFELKEKRGLLSEKYRENEKLEIGIMNLESYSRLDSRIKKLGFVKVGQLETISAKDDLAKK